MPKRIGLMALALALSACGGSSRVAVRGTAPLSYALYEQPAALAAQAPIVVLGTVQSVEPIGPVVRTADGRVYKVQLNRIRFHVENVLKGDVPAGRIDIYVYQWAERYILNGKNVELSPPYGRRIYFLALEGTRFRCFQDVYISYVGVLGKHPDRVAPSGPPVSEIIAEILLKPGQGVDPEDFGNDLNRTVYLSRALIGKARTLPLVKPLLASPHQVIRDWACVLMSESFAGQDACLDELIRRQDLPIPVRVRAEGYLQFRKQVQDELRDLLATAPLEWLERDAGSDDPAKMLDSLRVLTVHRDADVRKRACAFMARRFPADYTQNCGRASAPL